MSMTAKPTGFIGLGAMGEPMALNLAKAGTPLLVWNRSPGKTAPLAEAGASVAEGPGEVLDQCETVILMLADAAAIDQVLELASPEAASRLEGRTFVNMATISPVASRGLEARIRAAGGAYVEAPVSGSRKPAEAGQLVAMLSGEPDACDRVRPLLAPMCRSLVPCGPVPGAVTMKLAVNIFLIATLTGLAEAANFARARDLDMATFFAVANGGQMASDVSRAKVAKLESGDFSAQGAIANVLEMNRLLVEACREAGIAAPLTEACLQLYGEADASGLGAEDVIAVTKVYAERFARRP